MLEDIFSRCVVGACKLHEGNSAQRSLPTTNLDGARMIDLLGATYRARRDVSIQIIRAHDCKPYHKQTDNAVGRLAGCWGVYAHG